MNLHAEKIKLIEWLVSITDIQSIEKVSKLRSDIEEGLSQEEKLIIDDRLHLHEEDPKSGSSWSTLKTQLLG